VSEILSLAKEYVEFIFESPDWEPFEFHSVKHTRSVFEKANEWAIACNLDAMDSLAVKLAALFHDIGYSSNYKDHEAESIRMFQKFSGSHRVGSDLQEKVIYLIECTRKTHSDFTDSLACIMHDIDRAAMGMPDFIEQGLNLRKEWEHFIGLKTNDHEWLESQVQYLKDTHFKTDYGFDKYNAEKEKNLRALNALLAQSQG